MVTRPLLRGCAQRDVIVGTTHLQEDKTPSLLPFKFALISSLICKQSFDLKRQLEKGNLDPPRTFAASCCDHQPGSSEGVSRMWARRARQQSWVPQRQPSRASCGSRLDTCPS